MWYLIAGILIYACIWFMMRPMYWTLTGGAVGFLIGKKIDDASYYKKLATDLQIENDNLRKQLNDAKT